MEFTLKKKSWHLWLANFGSTRVSEYQQKYGTDICHYTRQVIWGAITMLAAAFGVLVLVVWIGGSFHNMYELIMGLTKEVWVGTFILWFLLFCTGVLCAIAYGADKHRIYRMNNPKPVKEPGFVRLSYRKFKDKTCFNINFKD